MTLVTDSTTADLQERNTELEAAGSLGRLLLDAGTPTRSVDRLPAPARLASGQGRKARKYRKARRYSKTRKYRATRPEARSHAGNDPANRMENGVPTVDSEWRRSVDRPVALDGRSLPDVPARWRPASHEERAAPRTNLALTCIIPAYNEAESIQDTVRSVLDQTEPPDVVIVVDDGSTDDTAALAKAAGATVLRPPGGTGSKAGAQSFALDAVRTSLTMVLDADSTLSPNAVAELRAVLAADDELAAACSYVVPRYRRTLWERGRYVEYLYAFGHGKQVQDLYGRPLISSGCFSMYRTKWLKRVGGWSSRTLAEDMDLTWTLYRMGAKVRFVPDAVCEPIEPDNFAMMRTQLRRWSHGFLQNVRVHRRGIVRQPMLRSVITVALWDGVLSAIFYVLLLPVLVLIIGPIALMGYVIDVPAIAVPVLHAAAKRGEFWQALVSLPSFFVLRLVNSALMLRAVVSEVILGRSFDVYEKGH